MQRKKENDPQKYFGMTSFGRAAGVNYGKNERKFETWATEVNGSCDGK